MIGCGIVNVLFWNTNKLRNWNNIDACLLELIIEKKCDIVILAEYDNTLDRLCTAINNLSRDEYTSISTTDGCQKIKGLVKKKYKIKSILEENRYQIVVIETVYYKLIIAMIHNISKLRASKEDQEDLLRRFHYDICNAEKNLKTKNTLVVGDFNANPFEPACISANTMHAIPFIEEVQRLSRTIQANDYEMFYSPMWKFWSRRKIPYATYYYYRSGMVNYYWNTFDQVIMRPQLINAFEYDSLVIVTETSNHQLLKEKKPDEDNYSDHLPLYCTLNEAEIGY
jgi:hypothetical protein